MTEHRTGIRRSLRWLLWTVLGMLFLVVLIAFVLQFPRVQTYLAHAVVSSISGKIHSRIEIGAVRIGLPNSVVLEHIYVEDQQHDTLVYIQSLQADINLFELFSHTIRLTNLRIDSLTAHITRTLPDSSYNFSFILASPGAGSHSSEVSPDTRGGKGWAFTIGGLTLRGIRLTYADAVDGLNARLGLGVLTMSVDRFDLDKRQFHIGKLSLENTSGNLVQSKESPPGDSRPADLGVGDVSLANIQLEYVNTVSGEHYGVELGHSSLIAETIDLPSHRVALRQFTLEHTNIRITRQLQQRPASAPDSTGIPVVFSLDHLALKDNNIRYDVEGTGTVKGLDPNHFHVSDLALQAGDIYFSKNRINAHIVHASLREHGGFELRELSGVVSFDSSHAHLADFRIETPASHCEQDILLTYPSLSVLTKSPGDVAVVATIRDSRISLSDVLYVQPSLPLNNKVPAAIRVSARLSGRIKDLRMEEFRFAVGESTLVDLSGSIRGLPEVKTSFFDLDVRRVSTGRADIHALLPDTLIPKGITLPASIRMSGRFKGTLKDFAASSDVVTSIGSLNANVTLASGDSTRAQPDRWETDITVQEFDVGSLLNDPQTFGPVSLKASATGMGLTREDLELQLAVEVDKFVLNGYRYRHLSLSGTAGPTMFVGKAGIKDSSIAFTFNGTVNTSSENPTYEFIFDLKGADLRRLNFTSDDIRVSGIITSDLVGKTINDINGNIDVRNVVIIKNRRRYVIDSLVYASINKEKQTHISFESSIFAGQFDGTIALGDLPEALKQHVAHYFTLQEGNHGRNVSAQAFTFHIALRDPTTLTNIFFPELHRLSAGTIEGNYDSDKKSLNVNIDIPRVDYNDVEVDSLTVRITSDADLLQATVRAGSIADSMMRVTNLQLAAKAGHDSIDVALETTRNDGSTKMLLAGVFNSIPDGYKFRFNKDGIVFHTLRWSVPADNELLFDKKKFVAHNVVVQGAGQSFSLNSTDEKNDRSPLRIEFNDFDLATLSQVVERDSGLLGGILNGNVVLQNLAKQMAFTSDLTIRNFRFSQRLLGDVALRANNQTENVYEVNMDITGNGNQIAMQGKYLSKEGGSELDLKFDFTKVNLASIEPFTFGKVRRLSGTMTGGLHITGTRKKPSINGDLNFTNTAFNPAFLDTYLHLNDGRIVIDGKGIEFRSFDLVDTLGNTASLRGHLFTEDFRSYSFDFRVHTENFLLLNKPASRDALYYGTVVLDSDISVTGDDKRQIVTMMAELDKGTDLALVLPESEVAVEERRGIVRFVDVTTPSNPIMSRRNPRTNRDTTQAKLSTMDLTSNITVNKDSRLRILIDPIAGDSLVIQGEATLSFTMDAGGKPTLTGRYEILEGSYQLSFGEFIRREFAIAKGSSLTWFGSPYEADVDITAIHTVKTTVLDLIQDQLTGMTQEERNRYKQVLPIQVYLMMKGKLLTPDIHFKLDLPPDKRGVLNGTVYAKLNELNGQESELNKQVFALLVLGRFISENPLASAGGNGGLSDIARSSASQILSAQLNRLSEQYITGMSVNVGLESYQDYSSGTAEGRTQLQLALSKELFNERVTVQVGGNVDLEGQRSQQNSLNNFAGDLKVLYKLTEDGRWQLQVFRQNSYEGAIDGDITRTGGGVVFTVDYDKLFGITLKPFPDEEMK